MISIGDPTKVQIRMAELDTKLLKSLSRLNQHLGVYDLQKFLNQSIQLLEIPSVVDQGIQTVDSDFNFSVLPTSILQTPCKEVIPIEELPVSPIPFQPDLFLTKSQAVSVVSNVLQPIPFSLFSSCADVFSFVGLQDCIDDNCLSSEPRELSREENYLYKDCSAIATTTEAKPFSASKIQNKDVRQINDCFVSVLNLSNSINLFNLISNSSCS